MHSSQGSAGRARVQILATSRETAAAGADGAGRGQRAASRGSSRLRDRGTGARPRSRCMANPDRTRPCRSSRSGRGPAGDRGIHRHATAAGRRAMRCHRCLHDTIVFPLHGVEKGGPLVCVQCAINIESNPERRRLLEAFGLRSSARPAESTEMSLELLKDVMALTHPDRHPPERADLAKRVTAQLTALKLYLRPAPKPPEPPAHVTDKTPSVVEQLRSRLMPSFPCVACLGYQPFYYCTACKAEWDKRKEAEREQAREKRREQYARRKRRRALCKAPSTCPACGEQFRPPRKDARYCSPACRQRAHRARVKPLRVDGVPSADRLVL
jgi:hypothetical protein